MNGTSVRFLGALALAGSAMVALGCPGDSVEPPAVASVEIAAPLDTLTSLGETLQLSAVALDRNGNPVPGVSFAWTSSDANLITVDEDGVARAAQNGDAAITVRVVSASGAAGQGPAATKQLTVAQRVSTVTVTPATATLQPGQTQTFAAAATDAGGAAVTGVTFFWTSSDHNVVVAEQTGIAKAIDVGTARVTAIGRGQPGSAQVTVSFGRPTRLAFSTQPGNALANASLGTVAVQILDKAGNVVTSATDAVTLVLGKNPWASVDARGGSLLGTVTANAVAGVATFNNVRIDKPGQGYALEAALGSGQKGSSALFNIGLQLLYIGNGGSEHTCGRDTANNAFCWGYNGYGQLGAATGITENDSVPALVRGGLSFSQVRVGPYHTCGIAGGAAYCWGANWAGQLGDGATSDSDVPVQVSGMLTLSQIVPGAEHTCALDTTGKAYCWGANWAGQLGDGTNTNSLTPVAVSGTLTFASITAGSYHNCARTSTNVAYCWGYNWAGQLGDASTLDKNVPTAVSGGVAFTSLTGGGHHTCGMTGLNQGYCWGYNGNGQLGDGTTTSKSAPTVIPMFNFTAMSAGGSHSCGIITSPANAGACWGWNGNGQLGDGTTINRTAPTAVSGVSQFATITASSSSTCGLASDGRAYCWGNNDAGQLGDGTLRRRLTPTLIVQ